LTESIFNYYVFPLKLHRRVMQIERLKVIPRPTIMPPRSPEMLPRPPEALPRSPEALPRSPEALPRPPEVLPRPPEAFPRLPEAFPRPPEAFPRPFLGKNGIFGGISGMAGGAEGVLVRGGGLWKCAVVSGVCAPHSLGGRAGLAEGRQKMKSPLEDLDIYRNTCNLRRKETANISEARAVCHYFPDDSSEAAQESRKKFPPHEKRHYNE